MKKILLLSTFIASSLASQAQVGRMINHYQSGKSKWYYHSLQLGLNAVMPTKSDFTFTFQYPDDHPSAPSELKTFTANANTKTYFMGHAAVAVNLMKFNPNNGMALTIGFDGFAQGSEILDSYVPNNITKTNLNYLQMNFGVPIALAYKSGGEMSHDKADKYSFTIGYGLAPAFSVFSLFSGGVLYEKTKLNMNSFLMAEVGMFAGINWKLRVSVYPGGFYRKFDKTIENYDVNRYGSTTRIQYSGNGPIVQLGFAVMPFSFGWYDGRW